MAFSSAADEPDLVRRSADGDTEAFAQIVERHQGRVRAYIGSYLRWADVVNDLPRPRGDVLRGSGR
jgi:class 3 adenylate cyclase